MNKITTKIVKAKNHVRRHRAKYAAAATATAAGWLLVKQGEQWNQFLTENDLWDKFYDYTDEI